MTREEASEYWEGWRKTFSSQLEKEENHFGRMHLQTTIEALDMAISALRQQDVTDKYVGKMTNAQKIRDMSDEELAKLLLDGCRGSKCDDQPQNEWGSVNCFQCRLEWLQQPAEEDKHENLD